MIIGVGGKGDRGKFEKTDVRKDKNIEVEEKDVINKSVMTKCFLHKLQKHSISPATSVSGVNTGANLFL